MLFGAFVLYQIKKPYFRLPIEHLFLMEKLTIKSWAEEDRPREKLLLKGKQALTEAELIAILIGSGNAEETAVELSRRILARVENNLHELSRLTVSELMEFKGIGEAKAITIVAALELGRRRKEANVLQQSRITTSLDAANIFQPLLCDNHHEEFWLMYLNRNNRVLGKQPVSSGGLSGTVVDPKLVFKNAIENKASSIILCHNHPSGNLKPSDEDIKLTGQLRDAGKLLDIQVLDHIIVSQDGFFSFADEGLL
jgi:DNA repair protein RadC